ncbi:EVE domain-containing protein [Paenibacillus aurantius]|uniref:EVE domain-containing protein n=1 Tax=Paenibacillus aurantius TaxID=2918900 RepID=A0AA96LF80_9BACL|nr:EVE domain-containing protein [Paenibacillus aurantius]WNQ12064.1 EVE domain-containing protein [Paenibacillus aurantius]
MDERNYKESLASKGYVKGRGEETEYYIITAKYGVDNYKLTLLRKNKVIFEGSYEGLTKAKYGAFEWLLCYDPSIFKRNVVTMVHYKDDRKSGDPWVKDTNIELHKNLEKFLAIQGQLEKQERTRINTWIFQGNPSRFKVDDYLRENQDIVWSIRQEHYVKDVQVGDTVYIWRSEAGKKGNGGIVARATVTGLPVSRKDVTSEYWVTPSDANEVLPRVPMHVQELALEGDHLSREFLKSNPVLSNLLILKMSNNTNYLLSAIQAEELLKQWNNNVSKSFNVFREIPLPNPVSRNREYSSYSEDKRNEVVYEYLFNSNTHRWIDEHTLELDPVWSRGYQAMGILHHLGLKNAFKGLFKGLSVVEAIDLIKQECYDHPADRNLYAPIISSLSGIKINERQDDDSIGDVHSDEGKEYPEGKIAFVLHKKRERNPKLIKEAKKLFISKHGRLYCEACKFDFQQVYGDRGNDFIEGHHNKLVSEMKEGEKTKVEDIAMLCSNCHRMVHKKPIINIEDLGRLIKRENEP